MDNFNYFLFLLLVGCGEDLCRVCKYCPPKDAEQLCVNLSAENGPTDRICLQGIRKKFEEKRVGKTIFFCEKNIHGEWVIYGVIGMRRYSGYSKKEALAKYRAEFREKFFFNQGTWHCKERGVQ